MVTPCSGMNNLGNLKAPQTQKSLNDKLTHLKTLVAGEAKTAIAEFVYCRIMYKGALRTLERKFGQPQAVFIAHLDKLSSLLPLNMNKSDNLINFSAINLCLVGVFHTALT